MQATEFCLRFPIRINLLHGEQICSKHKNILSFEGIIYSLLLGCCLLKIRMTNF